MENNQLKFIVVDGPDGVGKTTIVTILKDYFVSKGYKVSIGRGLGTGDAAESIRKTMFNNNIKKSTNYEIYGAVMCLIDCYETFVLPKLRENISNEVIILDRYVSSYYAYQVHARDSTKAVVMLRDIFNVPGTIHPDLYIDCRVTEENALKRLSSREDNNYFDEESLEFRNKVADGFKQFFNASLMFHTCKPSKVFTLDCNPSIDVVTNNLHSYFDNIVKDLTIKDCFTEKVQNHAV